jgi:hypothetical protein
MTRKSIKDLDLAGKRALMRDASLEGSRSTP